MGAFSFFFLLLSCCCTLFLSPALPGPAVSVTPNFTASHLKFIAASGAFLASRDNSFQARITNPQPESTSFYLVIIHAPSGTVVWSANRKNPISQSSQLLFTATGLALLDDSGHPIWSTPPASSSLSSLQLTESGNLVLLDVTNTAVWQSFDYPTDVLVPGQRLRVGQMLVSSEGSYRLAVGDGDAMLQWNEMSYWKLSMHKNSFRDTDLPVEYMLMNSTGLYLMSNKGQDVVIKVILPDFNDSSSSSFRIMKLDHDGLLTIKDDCGSGFAAPDDRCRIPFICRRLGVCANGGACQCAPAFHTHSKISASGGDCVPSDGSSLALPSAGPCDAQVVTYLNLMNGLDYFSNDFTDPEMRSVNLSACQGLCSSNCSCLGVFYSQDSGLCYMIRDFLGSVLIKSSSDLSGYIKTTTAGGGYNLEKKKESDLRRHVLTVVLLPLSGLAMFVVLVALIATLVCCGRRKMMRWGDVEDEMDLVSIPGLPVRMDYEELVEATQGFGTQIGSGGFGTVYKGTLAKDGTEVAVKKMTCLGAQGKREFLTEIAVIGKIRHVNLVRLKGFCVHGAQKFIVYEYMKRGSLDRTLFGGAGDEPVLGWKERWEIAVGTARGLAYLHWGCEHKILHCDIKPENILLHGESQVRISDFGLSKLLSTEQSGLFTTLRGTRGYLAPEWLTRASISDRTDVYSYGMVLLEMIRGKKNSAPHQHGSSSSSSSYFPLFALEMHEEGRYLELVDPRLAGRVGREEAEKLVRVALCCVHEEPGLRPSMTSVVGMLEGGVALGEPRMESLTFLRLYGRRFTEESMLGTSDDELMMMNATAHSPRHSFSYISSHQVSGPR